MITTMVRVGERAALVERATQLDTTQSVLLRRALLRFLKEQEEPAAAVEEGT